MWYGNQLINNFWQLKVGSLEKKIVKRIIPIAQISLMHDFHARNPPPEFFVCCFFFVCCWSFCCFLLGHLIQMDLFLKQFKWNSLPHLTPLPHFPPVISVSYFVYTKIHTDVIKVESKSQILFLVL